MNLSLTAAETIFLYETLLTTKVVEIDCRESHQKILSDLRSMILDHMQTVQDQNNQTKFETWFAKEEKRLNELNKQNNEIKVTNSVVKKGQKNARIIRKTA